MKILFTIFTPPFVQVVSSFTRTEAGPERTYLEYADWYAGLRRLSARRDTVKVVSFTRRKERFSITHDGYEAVFFPVTNPDERPGKGRWDFNAPGLVEWVEEYDPDVIHIVGTGHLMALKILERRRLAARTCLWLRGAPHAHVFEQREPYLCRYFVLPFAEAIEEAARRLPREKLLSFPLGADVTAFRPDPGAEKRFDVISVGGTGNKQVELVREIVRRNGLSWLHAGRVNKGWPFSRREDFFFFHSLRKRFNLTRVKRARGYPHTCGFFASSEMPGLYNGARVLVHPSLAEGAPRCVQEALACGVPVVVLKDTVPYVEDAFGAACKGLDEVEGAVLSILADEEKRVEMGRRGREWLVRNHSPERLHEAVSAINARIVEETAAGPRADLAAPEGSAPAGL